MVFKNFAQFCLKKQNYFTCMFLSQSASFQITSFQTQILQNKKLFKPEQRNKEKSLNRELRILLNPHNYFTNWFSFNKGVGMGQVLLEILWALPWQDLPTTIKHTDVKALATWAKTLWGVVTVIIMYPGILRQNISPSVFALQFYFSSSLYFSKIFSF